MGTGQGSTHILAFSLEARAWSQSDKLVAVFAQGASGDQNPLYLRASTNFMTSRYNAKITRNMMTRELIEAPLRDGKVQSHKANPQAINTMEKVMESEGVLLGEAVICGAGAFVMRGMIVTMRATYRVE